ncbi:S-adenosyl-L-methionine-dependent methyltransferase [Sporodiniella umbellata]|nr:S-adenosyl-L-methionine-dependent methyltransferase [Sporodiniella umbellata]
MGSSISQYQRKKKNSSNSSKNIKHTSGCLTPVSIRSPTASFDSVVLGGRTHHSEASTIYLMPNDEEEMDRLIGQHFAFRTLLGGNLPEESFNFVDLKKGAKVLDLGCGPGTWIMDMATDYPNSEFTGIDMCDVFPANIRPVNVEFKIANVLERLPFEDNEFDVVNFTLFILALNKDQWIPVLKEIKRVVKPGGLLSSREVSMLLEGNEFIQWANQAFVDRLIERNQDPYIYERIKDLIEEAGFEVIHHTQRHTYPGRSDHLNRDFLWDIKNIFKNCRPFLQDYLNLTSDQYPNFLERIEQECKESPEPRWDVVSVLGKKV